ncbi:MAG: class I SAM-dependent methyltransferase [Candidatus Binataceae bacterium]
MSRADDDRKFTGSSPGAPEPFVTEMLPLLTSGLALDVAAGRGRHSIALARAGMSVIAVDHSIVALEILDRAARGECLQIFPVVAELENFIIRKQKYQLVLNVNFLDRALMPALSQALVPGGFLLFDTFLADQAALGHPRNPDFLLQHYELRSMLEGLELLRYREGLTIYSNGTRAWRASALARRI